jgi:hypothetical protein
MTRKIFVLALAAVVALGCMPAAQAEDGSPSVEAKLIESKGSSIVSLKFVLNAALSFQGQNMDREISGTATGVMIDESGLIMLPARSLDAAAYLGIPAQMRSQVEISSTPSNIKVIFPGDDKEFPAILGAKDSKLGLAFVLIKDLGDKKPTIADMSDAATPGVGDEVYGVSRLDQGFDHAPMCSKLRVIGKVTKPRKMWALDSSGMFLSQPLYTAAGQVVGICISQEGVGAGSATRAFVLPLAVAGPTIKKAKKEAERALEEILEAEAENAAAEKDAAAAGDGEKADGEGEKKPEEPKTPEEPKKPDGDGDE